MKIETLKIKNFRVYYGETAIAFEDLTAFVGKNDIGKSSALEALDVFLMITRVLLNSIKMMLMSVQGSIKETR